MNQVNWTYVADKGKKHQVGLMHGAQSGHLLVYCDARILLIDFSVLDTKTYSFFIDEQLCEIEIEKKGNQFLYGFEINKTADTPRNRMRKKIEKRHFLQGVSTLGGVLVVIALSVYGLLHWNKQQSRGAVAQRMLAENGQEGKGRISELSASEAVYFYIVDGQSYSSETDLEEAPVIILENGMPLEKGDEFVVTYVPDHPEWNEIDYNRPTSQQITRYHQRAIDQHLSINPQVDSSLAVCMVNIAFELKGVSGLADFYFQKANPEENPQNNELTYKRLVRDLPFQNREKRCWE